MEQPNENEKAPASASPPPNPEPSKPRRLPYPPPPHVLVRLCPKQADGLSRLCGLTGLDHGEAAAVLLGPAPQTQFKAIVESQHALHEDRLKHLGAQPTGRVVPGSGPPGKQPIRIPLSSRLNRSLYGLAVESGLTRHEVAKELLERADLAALINDLAGMPGQGEPTNSSQSQPS